MPIKLKVLIQTLYRKHDRHQISFTHGSKEPWSSGHIGPALDLLLP